MVLLLTRNTRFSSNTSPSWAGCFTSLRSALVLTASTQRSGVGGRLHRQRCRRRIRNQPSRALARGFPPAEVFAEIGEIGTQCRLVDNVRIEIGVVPLAKALVIEVQRI